MIGSVTIRATSWKKFHTMMKHVLEQIEHAQMVGCNNIADDVFVEGGNVYSYAITMIGGEEDADKRIRKSSADTRRQNPEVAQSRFGNDELQIMRDADMVSQDVQNR